MASVTISRARRWISIDSQKTSSLGMWEGLILTGQKRLKKLHDMMRYLPYLTTNGVIALFK